MLRDGWGGQFSTTITRVPATLWHGMAFINSWILNPFSVNENLNRFKKMKVEEDSLRELQESGESVLYPLFPAEGGILPFGITDNGDVLPRLTKGATDE